MRESSELLKYCFLVCLYLVQCAKPLKHIYNVCTLELGLRLKVYVEKITTICQGRLLQSINH